MNAVEKPTLRCELVDHFEEVLKTYVDLEYSLGYNVHGWSLYIYKRLDKHPLNVSERIYIYENEFSKTVLFARAIEWLDTIAYFGVIEEK